MELLLSLLLSTAILFSCVNEPSIQSVSLLNIHQIIEYDLDDFDYDHFKLLVLMDDGTTKEVELTRSMLSIEDQAKLQTLGEHTLTVHYQGFTLAFTIHIKEPSIQYTLAEGRYDLSNISPFDKGSLLAALEHYLQDSMYGGVPLFSKANPILFSDRVELYRSIYNAELGFGVPYSTLIEDDSSALFPTGVHGKPGEFTLRSSYTYEPTNLFSWFNTDQSTEQFLEYISGFLYKRTFNASNYGFDIVPSLAQSEPRAINPETSGEEVLSTLWQIDLKDHLKWSSSEESAFEDLSEAEELSASDFVWTWKTALMNMWPRASMGSFSLVKQNIKNVDQFLLGTSDIDDIGIRVAEGLPNTIELEFDQLKNSDDLKLFLSTLNFAPVHQELYERVGDDYGKTAQLSPSSGEWMIDSWIPNDHIRFKPNMDHPEASNIFLTGLLYTYYLDRELSYQAFMNGELDQVYLPIEHGDEHISNPNLFFEEGLNTWRLGINAFGTEETRDLYILEHPDHYINDSFVPEPILSYLAMRQALYYGTDRLTLTEDAGIDYLPEHMLISSAYLIDPGLGLSFRDHPSAQDDEAFYQGDTFGYDPIKANILFHDAVTEAIQDGYYEKGTPESYQIISINLSYQSAGSNNIRSIMHQLANQYESVFIDDENYVRVQIEEYDYAFPSSGSPSIFYTASYDLALGSIYGAFYDLPSYFEVFSDQEIDVFGMNYGIDTTSALIPVSYTNDEHVIVNELWGYNALISALKGLTDIEDGIIQTTFDSPLDLIESYMTTVSETSYVQIEQHDAVGEAFLQSTLIEYANDLNVDQILSYVAVTEEDADFLFIMIKEGSDYRLDQVFELNHQLHDVIQDDVREHYGLITLIAHQEMLTDQDLVNHPYLQQYYDFLTIEEIAEFYSVPESQLRVYSTTWRSSRGVEWNDVFLLLEIDGYMIPLEWL
jgi:ABC-type oligopeptide transport system substrate-binding subunit